MTVKFNFDNKSLRNVQSMTKDGGFKDMGETVKVALEILQAIQSKAKQGYKVFLVKGDQELELCVEVVK